jgi:serine/threonine-protein kinase
MLIGKQLGPFAIDKELGSGAMGAVYRAKYVKTGAFVAIKVMAPGVGAGEQAMARFEREAAILKQLKHPNIVRLFATGRFHGQPFYAMEYIEGESLDHSMARRGRLTWEEVVKLGIALCDALQHAHDKGIIHRDLKPSNLMVLRDDTIKLTDFGIAKDLDMTGLTSAHCTVGTAAYMSPEQCKGERDLTHKSDLYSLGVVLYELVTGRKPFSAETPMDMFLQHVQGKFERPSRVVLDMPIWMDTLICQLLEKKPELRPMNASMVGSVLAQIRDKVASQKSAGVDAVEKRRADRTPFDPADPDEQDKQAAKTLKMAMGKAKPKRRKKLPPFLQRKWVQAGGIIAALLMIVGAIYWASRPPRPETLYERAAKLMKSSDTDDWETARDGPIAEYLDRYGHDNSKTTRQVQDWADMVDILVAERHLSKPYWRSNANTPEEKRAGNATVHEERDEYLEAKDDWQELAKAKDTIAEVDRPYILVAEHHLDQMEKSEAKEAELASRLALSNETPDFSRFDDEIELLAAEAIWKSKHCVTSDDFRKAQEKWDDLKSKSSKKERLWQFMASRNKQSLKVMEARNSKEPPPGSGQ